MFNPLNLGVFRLLFLVVEVYFLAPVGCECVCFRLREKFFIPARYLSLTQRSYWVYTRILPVALDIGYIRGYYPSVTRSGIDSGFLSIYSLS